MQDIKHIHMLHLHVNVAQPTASIILAPGELSPTNDRDAELHKQFLLGIDLKSTKYFQTYSFS